MTARDLSFVHVFRPATAKGLPPVLLLHGTGGDETDLLNLGAMIAPGAALLSPRGQVLEGGMPRFFRRLAEGVFDEDDIRRRAGDLARFVAEARAAYGLEAPVALGFSNGANIAAATLLLHPEALGGGALLRAMVPLEVPPEVRLDGRPILMTSGAQDPIIPAENAARLAALLTDAGAEVERHVLPAGHGLTTADVELARAWFARQAAATALSPAGATR